MLRWCCKLRNLLYSSIIPMYSAQSWCQCQDVNQTGSTCVHAQVAFTQHLPQNSLSFSFMRSLRRRWFITNNNSFKLLITLLIVL